MKVKLAKTRTSNTEGSSQRLNRFRVEANFTVVFKIQNLEFRIWLQGPIGIRQRAMMTIDSCLVSEMFKNKSFQYSLK